MCFPSARLRLRHYTRRHLLHPKRIENRHLLTSIRFVYHPTLVRPRQEVMRSRKLGIPSVSENQHFIANMKQVRLGPHPGRERRWPRANRRACREKPFPGPYHCEGSRRGQCCALVLPRRCRCWKARFGDTSERDKYCCRIPVLNLERAFGRSRRRYRSKANE